MDLLISFDGVTIEDDYLTAIHISKGAVTMRGRVKGDGQGRLLEAMLASRHVGDVVIFECIDFGGREFSGVGTITELKTKICAARGGPEMVFLVTITAGVQAPS